MADTPVRITAMDVFPIQLTLADPIPMASGAIASTGNVLVRLRSDEGLVGWGEGVEAPALTGHRQGDIVTDLEAIRHMVVGSDAAGIGSIWAAIRETRPAASTALGAVDIALHDLVGRALGVPAHVLIGGAARDMVPALTLVGSGDGRRDLAKLEERSAAGFTWFKIKLGMAPSEVEWATVLSALDLVGPDGVVCGDANEAWDEAEALRFLDGLTPGVRFVEQPVPRDDPASLLRVADRSPVQICADESAGSLDAVRGFAGTSIGGVSLKLIKHGGITGVMRGAATCAEAGLAVNLAGKVIESSISAAANLHCAAAMESIDYGCSPANQGVVLDVTETPITVESGWFPVPPAPGLGVEVDEGLVRRLRG
ncbi:MAG TPA: enolase C-terminal domain-like protein [Acidimicrobiia bacterium]